MRLAENARHTGSEVMGLMASGCQLTPTADSLKTQAAGPSSSQPFVIFAMCPHFSTASPKSQPLLFHDMKENFNKFSLCSIQKFWYTEQLTNLFVCGLMSLVYITKTLTENLPLFRCLQRAGGRCEPERSAWAVWFPSRSRKRAAASVMGPGVPRYRDRAYWSPKRSPPGR